MTGKNGGTSTAAFLPVLRAVYGGGGATACSLPIAIEPLSFGELWNEILILTVSRRSLSARYQQQAYAWIRRAPRALDLLPRFAGEQI